MSCEKITLHLINLLLTGLDFAIFVSTGFLEFPGRLETRRDCAVALVVIFLLFCGGSFAVVV